VLVCRGLPPVTRMIKQYQSACFSQR
jgi:hypothetical protein